MRYCLLALLIPAVSGAVTLEWTCPTYFTEAGQPCGGDSNLDRGPIPDSLTLMLVVEGRDLGGSTWNPIHTFPDWQAGQSMSLFLELDTPGSYEFRVNPICKDVGTPRVPCPSDPVLVVVSDNCPVEKMATPTVTP